MDIENLNERGHGAILRSIFLPDKIHYQKFDSLGRVVQVLVDNDAKAETGKSLTGNDGEQVNGIDQVLAYSKNIYGRNLEMMRDNNVDGVYDYREAYTLDANGHQLEKLIDLTNDGPFDRKEVYTREADGGLVKTHFYNLVDGKEVLTKIEDYELNANNQRTKLSLDTLGDGSIDAITTYELDALGRTAKAYFDTDGDGVVDRIESYTQDSVGNILRIETDTDNDGQPNVIQYYERDALGRVLVQTVDDGADGIINVRAESTRDAYGNEIAVKNYAYNPITKELELVSFGDKAYTTDNRLSIDNRVYVTQNSHTETVYTYDDYGRRDKTFVTDKNTGITTSYSYTYNADNSIATRADFDRYGNQTSKSIFTKYDAATGANIEAERYNMNDELVYITIRFVDSRGFVLNSLYDYSNNGKGWDSYFFGNSSANSNIHTSVDMTSWTEEQLAQLGESLNLIRMANGSVSQLTLNAEVVAKISEGGLQVRGAADKNDVLNLSGFTKADSSDVRNYDLYTASFDGEDLNLYVQANDSITVNIIG